MKYEKDIWTSEAMASVKMDGVGRELQFGIEKKGAVLFLKRGGFRCIAPGTDKGRRDKVLLEIIQPGRKTTKFSQLIHMKHRLHLFHPL